MLAEMRACGMSYSTWRLGFVQNEAGKSPVNELFARSIEFTTGSTARASGTGPTKRLLPKLLHAN